MSSLVYHDGMPAGDEPTLLGYAIFNWDGVVAAALLATAPADHYLTRCIVQLVADSGSPSGSGFIVNLDSGPCPSPDALTPAEADTFRLQSDRLGLPMDDTQRWAYVGARWDLPPDEEEPIESPIGVLGHIGDLLRLVAVATPHDPSAIGYVAFTDEARSRCVVAVTPWAPGDDLLMGRAVRIDGGKSRGGATLKSNWRFFYGSSNGR